MNYRAEVERARDILDCYKRGGIMAIVSYYENLILDYECPARCSRRKYRKLMKSDVLLNKEGRE